MMGLSNWLHWMAWFIKYTVFLFITVLIMTILLAVKTDKGAVINKSNPVIIFIFLMLYAISTISFCCTVSVFFSKGEYRKPVVFVSGCKHDGFLNQVLLCWIKTLVFLLNCFTFCWNFYSLNIVQPVRKHTNLQPTCWLNTKSVD